MLDLGGSRSMSLSTKNTRQHQRAQQCPLNRRQQIALPKNLRWASRHRQLPCRRNNVRIDDVYVVADMFQMCYGCIAPEKKEYL
jgi:hypothetical protein